MAQGYSVPLFVQTANGTVSNTVTETTILAAGQGQLTIPADSFTVGKTLKFLVVGFHSSVANPNINIRVKIGSVTVLTTGAQASGNGTNDLFSIEAIITCRTTGATGTVIGQGVYSEIHSGGTDHTMISTATTTIDTTVSNTIDVTVEWGTASSSNTITATNIIIEMYN